MEVKPPPVEGEKVEAPSPEKTGRKYLEQLKKQYEAKEKALEETGKKIENLSSAPEKDETFKAFREYLSSLNNKHFNLEWKKKHLSKDDYGRYEKLAGLKWYKSGFKDGMEDFMDAELEMIYEKENPKKQEFITLKNKLADLYKGWSNKEGFIELKTLQKLRDDVKPLENLATILGSGKNEKEMAKEIEALALFEPHHLKEIASKTIDQLEWAAKENGVDLKEEDMDKLRDQMDELAETGVLGTEKMLDDLNKLDEKVNKGRVDAFNAHVTKDSIKGMVCEVRAMLLKPNPRLDPDINPDNIAVVRFMRTNIEGKKAILKNKGDRQELFQAIQNILQYYPKEYDTSKIPDEIGKLVHSRNPDKPTKHDRIARAMAMLTLAEESKWIIKNLGQAEALQTVTAEDTPPKPNFKFRDVLKLYPTQYVTLAERSGFNGKELAKAGLKFWAWGVAISNIMAARKDKNWESLAKNPWMYLAGGTLYALHKVNQNPEMADYFKQDPAGKERITTQSGLISLSKKYGGKRVLPFIQDANEFRAMEKVRPSDIKNMLEKVETDAKEKKEPPVITAKDLETYAEIPKEDKGILDALAKPNDRMRYLFYKTFLTKGRNIRELKKNCDDWTP